MGCPLLKIDIMKKVFLFSLCISACLLARAQEVFRLVDLGLSVRWADRNVGAAEPEDNGDYYAWGEMQPKEEYTWLTYKYSDGTDRQMNKYCCTYDYGVIDSREELERRDDVAYQQWGDMCRIPTRDQWIELRNRCHWTWEEIGDSIYGFRVTANNGNSIFLPAAGYKEYKEVYEDTYYGFYWSIDLYKPYPNEAISFTFVENQALPTHSYRGVGLSIRPVAAP